MLMGSFTLEGFDDGIVYGLRKIYLSPLGRVFEDLRWGGNAWVLLGLTILVAFWFAKKQSFRAAGLMFLLWGSALGLNHLLKMLFRRPRPVQSWASPELIPDSYSFPSGHAMLSAAVYLGILFLSRHVSESRLFRITLMILAPVLTLAVGFSRVVITAHYFTDVIVGWILGLMLALLANEMMKKQEPKTMAKA